MIKNKSHSKKPRRYPGGWLRDERGATLVIVTVIMMVFTLAATGIAVLVLNTTSLVNDGRGNVQSRAAADAGITAAVAAAQRGEDFCDPITFNRASTDPKYTLTTSCTADEVTFTSIGEGGGGAVTTSIAVYQRRTSPLLEGGATSDASFFDAGNMNNITIVPDPNNETPPTYYSSGSGTYMCNTVALPGDLYIAGNFALSGPCSVTGSLWVGGNANLNGDTVTVGGSFTVVGNAGGSAKLNVGGATHIGGNANLTGGEKILTGPLYIHGSGASYFNGKIGRSDLPLTEIVTNGPLEFVWPTGDGIIYANVFAKNNLTINGRTVHGSVTLPVAATLNQNGTTIVGGVNRNNSVTMPSMPPAPVFPGWMEYVHDLAHWPGFAVRYLAAEGKCNDYNSRNGAGFTDLETRTTPLVVDGRGCGTLALTPWNVSNPITLKAHVVFVADAFTLGGLGLKAAPSTTPRMWVVTEGPAQDGRPVCTPAKSAGITVNSVHVEDPAGLMLYTPCNVKSSGGGTIRGSVYSGGFIPGGTITIHGRSLTLPGSTNSDPSGGGPGGGSNTLGWLISQRDSN